MNRRLRALVAVGLMVLVACGDNGGSLTGEPTSATAGPTPDITATIEATNGSAEGTPTVPEVLTEDEIWEYYGLAATVLYETPWNVETLGEDAFLKMITDGAISACASLQLGETMPEAMYQALQDTPLIGRDPTDYDEDAAQLVWALVAIGVPIACPYVDAGLPDSQLVADSWQELTGG